MICTECPKYNHPFLKLHIPKIVTCNANLKTYRKKRLENYLDTNCNLIFNPYIKLQAKAKTNGHIIQYHTFAVLKTKCELSYNGSFVLLESLFT